MEWKSLTKEHLEKQPNKEERETIVQVGEGNFLRGFVDWMIHQLNEQGLYNGKVVAIQPTPHGKVVPKLNAQDGLYTTILRGVEGGETVNRAELIESISRGIDPYHNWSEVLEVARSPYIEFMFSNTTEAGLTYSKEDFNVDSSPLSYPGKVVAFLYERFKTFDGDASKGITLIPCELVEGNGDLLKEIVSKIMDDWKLPTEFKEWVVEHNRFCNTLVDRIVTGFPRGEEEVFRDRLGYDDILLTVGEPYHLFVIDAPKEVSEQLPFHKAGLNVKWGDTAPYRELKVRLLNGAHTMMFATCYLAGVDTVYQALTDEELTTFTKDGLFNEILPTVQADKEEKDQFAASVIERFSNPFLEHQLTDIGMNPLYKFKTRVVPSLLAYVDQNNVLPRKLSVSLAALLVYTKPVGREGAFLAGDRGGTSYVIRDNEATLALLERVWGQYDSSELTLEQAVQILLSEEDIWGTNLSDIQGLTDSVSHDIDVIQTQGIRVLITR
ncbi:tagaturonate reductase [Alkalicoccobacillus murimartini]|uniref:Tagaturonate reductase n=1 Tax=Alkalicoccobacillus murimartini TaxID=171685 RepID=A0ABT9YJR1_9BACI|nr:tagaturonate reductase [Alkalicoccobacillus murimartini]MDQ0207735.1 tagaturonate reductase [Alkalicoccobacillus murimartini]